MADFFFLMEEEKVYSNMSYYGQKIDVSLNDMFHCRISYMSLYSQKMKVVSQGIYALAVTSGRWVTM